MIKKIKLLVVSLCCVCCVYGRSAYAQSYTLSGKVYDRSKMEGVDLCTLVFLEAKQKVRTDADGAYQVRLPKGSYTVMIQSAGLATQKQSVTIADNSIQDFWLDPLSIKGASITITDERYVQNISRRTMNNEDLKATPASLGDSLNALTSLPGVDRTDGFFGPLVIRGMRPEMNLYQVDGMPILYPMHFGGLHSVINTNLLDTIDMYSSAFPISFGGATAAVIDMHTIDSVKERACYSDINLLSATTLLQVPLTRKRTENEQQIEENAGYIIASGRYGYLAALLPYILKASGEDEIEMVPEYYDYQFKAKYYLNNHHAISMLFLGSKDYLKFITKDEASKLEDGDDPLLNDLDIKNDEMFHNLGFYYDYTLDRLRNRLMTYGSMSAFHYYMDSDHPDVADWMKNYHKDVKPYIWGIKDNLHVEWWKQHGDLSIGMEYTYYYFRADGKTYNINAAVEDGEIDYADPDIIRVDDLDLKTKNSLWSFYADNTFTFGGLTCVPGVRGDYLVKKDKATFDYRGMLSYDFATGTTISLAGGRYSSFVQTNQLLFNTYPEIIEMDYLDPERAYHSVLGVEQEWGLYTLGIEGYYNYFYDQAYAYPHYVNGTYYEAINSGKARVRGVEIMFRKDREKGVNDFFGWCSYTYTRAKEKSGITGNSFDEDGNDTGTPFDATGDTWHTSPYERKHSLKVVLGYTFGKHTLSGKFQLYSSYPYTPIVGSNESPSGSGRYVPVYSDDRYSQHFSYTHRLDVRYTYKTNYSWGYISMYFEIINLYDYAPVREEDWQYNKPYASGGVNKNPEHNPSEDFDAIMLPNFGVEIKF